MGPATRTCAAYPSLASAHMPRMGLSDKESEFGLLLSSSIFMFIFHLHFRY